MMTGRSTEPRERMMEMLADRATVGLTGADEHELRALLGEMNGSGENAVALERAAAALEVAAAMISAEPLPESLRGRLEAAADSFTSGRAGRIAGGRIIDAPRRTVVVPAATWGGWAVAAVLGIVAVAGWWRAEEAPIRDQMSEFVREVSDAVHLDWRPHESLPADVVKGVVHWSPSQQRGFAHFESLPEIDLAKEDFQVWVFDASRPQDRQAISAGVFECSSRVEGGFIVELVAAAPVKEPSLIAVTVEPEGGAMQSVTGRVVALAHIK